MIRTLTILIATLSVLSATAQDSMQEGVKLNFGCKVGFHAATYNTTDFEIEGYRYDGSMIQSNKIGYSVSPFLRLSKKRFYLQTETTLSISRHYFEFIEESPGDDTGEGFIPNYKLTTYCVKVPLLVGYNFVQSGPYGMGLFTGPNAKFVFTSHSKQEFNHFTYDDMQERLRPVVLYWEIGLGVKIGNFFFDFVYDIGISNNARYIYSESTGKRFNTKRTDNLLSFSVGTIF